MTYSILALNSEKKVLGIAVASGSLAVGSRVPWAKALVGAVVTQAYTNPSLGPLILKLMKLGYQAHMAVEYALKLDSNPELRQVAAIDAHGNIGVHTGQNTPQWHGEIVDKRSLCVCIGNLIRGREVLERMHITYTSLDTIDFAERLILALNEGHKAGGDRRGDRSAAVLVVGVTEFSPYFDRVVDLRVDYSLNPIEDLFWLYKRFRKTI